MSESYPRLAYTRSPTEPKAPGSPLAPGDGGPHDPTMEGRVSALETHMEYVRRDLDEIKASLKVLPTLATKSDVTNWKIQWTALLVAALAVIIGSIVGGLGWLETRASRVQTAQAAAPIVIQVPTYQAPPSHPSK